MSEQAQSQFVCNVEKKQIWRICLKKWKVYGSFSDFRLFLFLHNTTLSSVFIHLHMEVSKSQDNLKTRLSLRDKADSGF